MKYIKTQNGVISTEEKNHVMRLAQGHAFLQSSPPSGAVEISPLDVGAEVVRLRDEISDQLVGMEHAVHLLAMGLVSGGNVFLWSLPGAAKSTMARMMAAGISGEFFSLNLGPDTGKSDLFGPPSLSAMKKDQWDRAWSRVATAHIALFDEWDKASQVVHNQLLTAMEEKLVTTNNGNKTIPMLLGIAAANDVVDPNSRNASWDRLLFRLQVKYPGDYQSLLTVAGGRQPVSPRLEPEDIQLIQGWVDNKAIHLTREIREAMSAIYAEMKRKGFEVSPRRFVRWARAIVAEALLAGRTEPEMVDLYTGANILWIKPEDMETVQKIVGASSDPEKAILVQAEATIEGVDQELVKLTKDTPNVLSKVMDLQTGLNAHRKQLEGIRNGGVQKEQLLKKIQDLNSDLIDKASEFSA
ncbi:MAG: MoxR family ATPase [Anaerolineales bacterium]|nr:MAG: MoxR family ATPase [Anaerolineales bacterium]